MAVNPAPHPDEEMLAAYLDGALQPHEKLEVERHLDSCPDCRESVSAIADILHATAHAAVPKPVRRSRRRLVPAAISLAAAASLTAIFLLRNEPNGMIQREERAPTNAEARAEIDAVLPADNAHVRRGDIELAWRSLEGAEYRVHVLSETGSVIRLVVTTDTTVLVPVDSLAANREYMWYVDAITNGIRASTHVRRFTVIP